MGTKLTEKEIQDRLSKERNDKLRKETEQKQGKCVKK